MLSIHGYIGILIIVFVEITLVFQIQPFISWTTPTAWTGYILLVDSILYRLTGRSLILHRTKKFAAVLLLSLVSWVIFELYNLYLINWKYINLPDSAALRLVGYVWSFATILPAILLTSELLEQMRIFSALRVRPKKIKKAGLVLWMIVGLVFLVIPLLVPKAVAVYLFGLVWVGFILFLDPLNKLLGNESLFADLEKGNWGTIASLMAAGYLCGLLWEFWNYWAHTKWIYTFPITQNIKYFEMPVAGFLGFGPFALELYAMYHFTLWMTRLGRKRSESERDGIESRYP